MTPPPTPCYRMGQGFGPLWAKYTPHDMEMDFMSFVTASFRLTGVSPLLMHNGQTADPMNQFARALKEVSGKRKKTDDDFARMKEIEWRAGLYTDAEGYIVVPSEVVESCLVDGAKKSKLGKHFKSAVMVDGLPRLLVDGKPCLADKIEGLPKYTNTMGVRVGQSRVMRTRPVFPVWALEIEVSYNHAVVNAGELVQAIDDAGSLCGICDYRPKFGRFVAEKVRI